MGASIPARPPVAGLSPQRLDNGLVWRHAGVPLLHGVASPCRGAGRRDASVWRCVKAHRCDRLVDAACRMLGIRPSCKIRVSDSRIVCLCWPRLFARRKFHDLRRQLEVDDGGRILVFDRPHIGDARPRRVGCWVENRQIPGVDGGTDCSGCGVAWNCPHLHRSGGTRVHCPVGRWQPLAMGVDDGHHRLFARCVVGWSVLDESRVHDRHEIWPSTRGSRGFVLGHVFPVDRAVRRHHLRACNHRGCVECASSPSERKRARHNRSCARCRGVPGSRFASCDWAAVEPSVVAVSLPRSVHADDGWCCCGHECCVERREGAAGSQPGGSSGCDRLWSNFGTLCAQRAGLHVSGAARWRHHHSQWCTGVWMGAV